MTKEEFVLWKNHPATRELFDTLKAKQEELSSFVLFGGTLGDSVVQNTARAVGRNEAYQDVIDWNPVEETESV